MAGYNLSVCGDLTKVAIRDPVASDDGVPPNVPPSESPYTQLLVRMTGRMIRACCADDVAGKRLAQKTTF